MLQRTYQHTLETNVRDKMYNKLTSEEEKVIIKKGTEPPFTGKYDNNWETGIYSCKRCNATLYRSEHKFDSHCGWPSFDDEIPGAVKRIPDSDGIRTEIACKNCGGHLGHVFQGEKLTDKNVRHCVNSISLSFKLTEKDHQTERAIFAGGCFWGMEHFLQQVKGVISTTVGYTGGYKDNPTYEEVCSDDTGHVEAVDVVYDPEVTSYEELAKLFFEAHDPTQVNRQGPDVGAQYNSEIFYLNNQQKATSEKLIKILEEKNYRITTKVTKATTFWKAEEYHQDYYKKASDQPYCHKHTNRF